MSGQTGIDFADTVYQERWNQTWYSFNRALRSPDEFDAVTWLFRLVKEYLRYLYFRSGLYKLGLHLNWRAFVPVFGISLILAVLLSYWATLRSLILPRWCCKVPDETSCHPQTCMWTLLHDFLVCYLGMMILFNYISACFRSPGVALGEDYKEIESSHLPIPPALRWKSVDSRGGFCYIDPTLDVMAERQRVSEYQHQKYIQKDDITAATMFPSLEWTDCKQCRISRPPRCHHCSVCNRCVLCFDHHCVWLNNCIGQNNYREFLLTLLFLTIGCWYGGLLLWWPFYDPLKQQILEHGWHILYDNKTGFLNLPPLFILMRQMLFTGLDTSVVVKLVVPLLVSVGSLQTIFLVYHIRYVMGARTTLEYKILLDRQYQALVQRKEPYEIPHNPFDHGWIDNLKKVLGPNPILAFLPIALKYQKLNDKKSR